MLLIGSSSSRAKRCWTLVFFAYSGQNLAYNLHLSAVSYSSPTNSSKFLAGLGSQRLPSGRILSRWTRVRMELVSRLASGPLLVPLFSEFGPHRCSCFPPHRAISTSPYQTAAQKYNQAQAETGVCLQVTLLRRRVCLLQKPAGHLSFLPLQYS